MAIKIIYLFKGFFFFYELFFFVFNKALIVSSIIALTRVNIVYLRTYWGDEYAFKWMGNY